MKRFTLALCVSLFLSLSAFAGTIPITGTIQLPDGSKMQGKVRFILSYAAARDTSNNNITVASDVSFSVANGALPATATIVPNDVLQPANTWYTVQYLNGYGGLVGQSTFYIQGTSFDIGSATPTPVTTSNLSFTSFTGLENVTTKRLDNTRFCDQFAGATASAKIIACLADVPSAGGVADARGIEGGQIISSTISIAANKTLLLGAATYTATTQAFNLTGSGARVIGLAAGNALTGTDPANSAALGVTNLIATGLGSTTDLIRVAIPTATRTSQANAIIYYPEVAGLWINLGNNGRRGVYATSSHYGSYHDLVIFNCTEDCFQLEADLSSPNYLAESYQNHLARIQLQASSTNTTGANLHLNASDGEIGWTTIENLRTSGNIVTGGGKQGALFEGGTATEHSITHTSIISSYIANPSCVAGNYGLQLKFGGTYATQSGARLLDLTIRDTLIERLFACAIGIGIGGTDNAGAASGTGIGSLTLEGSGVSANWATTIDRVNLGQSYLEVSGFTNPGAGQPSLRISGNTYGNNATGLYLDPSMKAGANNDSLFAISSSIGVDANGKNGLGVYGAAVSWGTYTAAGGAVTNGYSIYTDAPTFAANNYAFYAGSGLSRFAGTRVDGNLGVGVTASGQSLRVSQAQSGANTTSIRADSTITATAGAQSLFGVQSVPTFNTGGNAITSTYGLYVDPGAIGGGGSTTVGYGGYIAAPSAATTNIALQVNGALQMAAPGARPACSAAYRGTIWYEAGGAGVLDTLAVCRKDAADAYAWVSLF